MRLETGHGRACERLVASAPRRPSAAGQRHLVLPLDPAARAERLLEGVPSRGRLAPERQLHSRRLPLGAANPRSSRTCYGRTAGMSFLDDPARALEDRELDLGPLLRPRVLEPEPRRRAQPVGLRAREPVVGHEVVGERDVVREVAMKSNTASRGAEMTVSTVTGPTGPRFYGRASVRQRADDRRRAARSRARARDGARRASPRAALPGRASTRGAPALSRWTNSPGTGVRRHELHWSTRRASSRCSSSGCGGRALTQEVDSAPTWVLLPSPRMGQRIRAGERGRICGKRVVGRIDPSLTSAHSRRRKHGSLHRRNTRRRGLIPLRDVRLRDSPARARRRARVPALQTASASPARRCSPSTTPTAGAPRRSSSPSGWTTARDSLVTRGDYLAYRRRRARAGRAAPGGLDAAGPQPRGAHPLRRPDRVAPARAASTARAPRSACSTTAA